MLTIAQMALVASICSVSARAQDAAVDQPKPPRIKLMRNVTQACKADAATRCPATTAGQLSGSDEVICLKFYKSDLSLGCRHAVEAAQQP